ncbi:cytochrome P450 [Halenospora varia]|nr:cytochrome P450 [Halenospora varia]
MPVSVTLIATFLILSVAIVAHHVCLPLLKNVRAAKATGLHYVVVPYYHYNFLTARLMSRTFLRICDLLCSRPSVTSWRLLVTSAWPLKLRHSPFKAFGTDTFLIVAPGGIILNTADADVISQILGRGADFPKATEIYSSINIYGKNVVSSDGPIWRYHRKITSPAFSERNNQLVWRETLDRSRAMLESFIGPDGRFRTVDHIARDTTRLSLEVMGRASLGEKLEWSTSVANNSTSDKSCSKAVSRSFTTSLEYVTVHIVSIMALMALPEWVVRKTLCVAFKKSLEAYEDWGRHMRSMITKKRSELKAGSSETAATDLIGQLVRGQDDLVDGKSQSVSLTDSEVMGNLFVFIIAGHETSANTLQFALLLLALHPQSQKLVQKELAKIFGDRPASEWSFEQDLPALLSGMLGATLSEVLRLISPVLTIPKVVAPPSQKIVVDGKEAEIPAKTLIRLCIPAVHRNPNFWPCGPLQTTTNLHFHWIISTTI